MTTRRGRERTVVALVAAVLVTVTACGTEGGGDDGGTGRGGVSTGAEGRSGEQAAVPDDADLRLREGETFTWPDGLEVTVVKADEVKTSGYGAGHLPFQLHFEFHNGGGKTLSLDDFATFVEGATRGGEAVRTSFSDDTAGIGGRLAPGVTRRKTEDRVIRKEYGRKIVVTLQYGRGATAEDYPKVTATVL
ncbi:hypothetical protein GCM10009801_72140 [Streptomyces albiaxialis]|uniref:DUF5067 domain-containing protein n=1 Tax=Streptomyces albiaxialis TaxID=329523 RepID=A0ABN2WW89_9ACTN